jgi:hypothetical protein
MNPLTKARAHLRARALWAGVFALVGLAFGAASPAPPERTTEGVAAMLGAAAGGEVRPDDFVWEARGGFLADAFLGRRVLFLARRAGSAGADLYRARVQLTRAGRPLRLSSLRNLTRSPLGDDHDLIAQGHRAAYVTSAFGAVQGITLLDLDGEAPSPRPWSERVAGAIEGWLATGDARGIGRTEVTFGAPPPEARQELQGDLLVMALGKEALPAALDLHDGTLNTGPHNAFDASAQRIATHAPALAEVAVHAARETLGPAAARGVASALASLGRMRSAKRPEPLVAAAGEPAKPGEDGWPPPAMTPPIRPAIAGEGVWTAGRTKGAGAAPPVFFEASIRPDPVHPETVVRLCAIDARQVDLRLVAGMDEPRSEVGLHGTGRPPEGVPAERVVAAFAGGPASPRAPDDEGTGGEAGFVADRRVFVPPSQGLATVAITGDGRVELGPWPHGGEVPPAFASVRQTPDALLGWTGATRRALAHGGEAVERSALGLLPSGQLVYAWTEAATAEDISRALALAGCTYAVPLAASPAPAGFVYLAPGGAPEAEDPRMSLAGRSGSDLFYAVLRSTALPPLPAALEGSWAPDGGRQPSPAWLPAVHAAAVTSLGAQVHLTTFAPDRVSFLIRAGGREPMTHAVALLPTEPPAAALPRLLAAVGLGSGRRKNARGLSIDGAAGLPFKSEDAGALVLDHGRPKVARSAGLAPAAGVDMTELPMTADEGKLRPEARDVGSMRARAVACTLDDGTFAVAITTFDSDEAATTALLELGCARVVSLDRGSHQAAFVHRAGTAAPPEPRYDASALYAVEVPLSGRAGPLGAR